MKILFNVLRDLFAAIGFYIVLMTSVSIITGHGTVKVAGHCLGECVDKEASK